MAERKATAEESVPYISGSESPLRQVVKVAIEKLEKEVRCAKCTNTYENPKFLQCFHVFCEKCLKPEGQVVNCPDPKCGRSTSLPESGIAGLQPALHILHLFDIQETLMAKCKKCKKRRDASCYCHTCGFMCDKCNETHSEWVEFSTHHVIGLNQLTSNVTSLTPVMNLPPVQSVQEKLAPVSKAVEGVNAQQRQIGEQYMAIKAEIHQAIGQVKQALENRERCLIAELDELKQQKLEALATKEEKMGEVSQKQSGCQDYLQETGSEGEVVGNLVNQSDVLTQGKVTSFNPAHMEEKADLKFIHSQTELTQAVQQFGKVYDSFQVCHEKCRTEGSGLQVAKVGEAITTRVYVVDQEGRECQRPVEVNCELVSNDGSSRVRGKVERVRDDQYQISYLPECRGRHQLHIRVEDAHISGSPFTTAVFQERQFQAIELGNINARGIAMNQKRQIVVSESGSHAISIYTDCRNKVRKFGKKGSAPGELDSPKGVAITATDDILVCDYSNNRIQLFSAAGTFVKSIGSEGNGPLQFNKPLGIAVHPHSGKVYVTEEDNHRVQILTAELTFSSCYGSKGTANGQFICPCDVAFDSTGHVYIADRDNLRIQVFNESGGFVRKLGWKGVPSGELSSPCGIAIDSSDLVYVSEQDRTFISIFTRNGQFLKSLAISNVNNVTGLFGITVDKDGLVCGIHYYSTSPRIYFL